MVRDEGGGQFVTVTLVGGFPSGLAHITTMPDLTESDNDTDSVTASTPLATSVLEWLLIPLSDAGFPLPCVKRVVALVSGLLVASSARRGDLATALAGLHLSAAKPESIARRIARLLDDPRCDTQRLLPAIFTTELLTTLLQGEIAAHAANARSGASHHDRFRPLHLVVDLSTKNEQVVVLAVGLAYRGLVVPLAVRTWPHNAPLPEGTYWQNLLSALSEVSAHLPPVLRDHVILVADRAFGVPRMVDAANAFGWAWVLRVQGQVRVRFRDGTTQPIRTLAAHPGAVWFSGFGQATLADESLPSAAVAVFKDARWRGGPSGPGGPLVPADRRRPRRHFARRSRGSGHTPRRRRLSAPPARLEPDPAGSSSLLRPLQLAYLGTQSDRTNPVSDEDTRPSSRSSLLASPNLVPSLHSDHGINRMTVFHPPLCPGAGREHGARLAAQGREHG